MLCRSEPAIFLVIFICKSNALLLLMELMNICKVQKFCISSLQSTFNCILLLSGLHDFSSLTCQLPVLFECSNHKHFIHTSYDLLILKCAH
jgi:hypothetical protein